MELPECCIDCVKYEKFGDGCWVFWEAKKECTHQITNWDQEVKR
jgi:hypothetical protein